jgi:transposase-like protein
MWRLVRDRTGASPGHIGMSKPKQRADIAGRIEVIAKASRRRRWPEDVRAAIVAEALEEGAVVSAIARRHSVAPRQVFAWRKAAREQASALGAPTPSSGPSGLWL